MVLGFSTKWSDRMGGGPTHFVEKILSGMLKQFEEHGDKPLQKVAEYVYESGMYEGYASADIMLYSVDNEIPKIHTIRTDEHDRWKAGNDIHMVINNRTKNRFQFAPVVKCTGVQKIEFYWWTPERGAERYYKNPYDDMKSERYCDVYVDDRIIMTEEYESIARNDGFDSVEQFFQWFNKDYSGKIIHWTDLKY